MASNSWRETNLYKSSRRSGSHFESLVVDIVKQYTQSVWRNIRIETLLTQTGNTELDIVFYNRGIVYVLELKRVRRIIGEYSSRRWTMYGWSDHVDETSEYTAPNVIEQNNIHARSLMDLYFSEFRCFPRILPIIIVPDDCIVPPGLRGDVFTVQELDEFLLHNHAPGNQSVAYRLAFLMNAAEGFAHRGDFVDREAQNVGNIKDSTVVRGRRR